MTELASSAARYAGSRVPRVEDARLITGHGTYVDDIVRPGMLHACFVRSPFARARIVSIDTDAALALPGVHAVFTAEDLNHTVHEAWYAMMGKDVPDTPRPPLAQGEARFVGDPVAIVVADDRYIAEDAVDLVDVEYDPLPALVDYTTAVDSDVRVHEGWEHNLAGQMGGRPVDKLGPVFDDAALVVEETIYQQAYLACPMETRGLVAEWSAPDGTLTVWAASQAPHDLRGFAARLLGIPENRVRVIARDTGGAFGQKIQAHREDICVLLAARKVPGPLKFIEDRRENLMASSSRREHGTVKMAFDADGTYLAATIDVVQDIGAYPVPWPVGVAAAVGMIFPGGYRLPNATWTAQCVFSNTPGRTAYRGPWQFETVAREMVLDIAARELGVDPADLRRRNMLRRDELPYTTANRMQLTDMTPLETFEMALDILDYDAFRTEQATARADGRYLGVGTASYVEPTASGMPHHGSEGATIRVEPSGAVNVYLAGGSAGNSLETTAIQLTADALGVDISMVSTVQGDTALTPFGSGTGGSRSGSMVAGAIRDTAAVLRTKIAAIAAHVLEASPDDIVIADGRASVAGSESIGLSLAEIADIAYFGHDKLPREIELGLEASARYRSEAYNVWANATHVCTCEVDIETGIVTLLRYVVAEDCGPMINPNVVEGQIAGGTVQGIGGALLEDFPWDEDGNPLATTFVDYLLPTSTEVPTIEFGHMEDSPGPGPGGYKGVGEGGAIAAPAAVANAVADALAPLGVKITRLPLSPSTIIRLIDEAADPRDGWRCVVKATAFDYHAPTTIDETVALLAELDDAKVIAGGQSFVPLMALRLATFDHIVDLRRVDGVRGIEERNGEVWIGAATTQAVVEHDPTVAVRVPMLARALPLIGHFQIRNRGTIGGSLAHADPAAELPAVAVALDAVFEAASPTGRRDIPAAQFFDTTFSTALGDGELLTGIRFPIWAGRCGFAVEEVARRHGDFAIAGACIGIELADDHTVRRCAIGLFGLGSTPLRADAAEQSIVGSAAADIDVAELGRLVVDGLTNIPTDLNGSASYRSRIAATVVARATTRALEEARRV